MSGARPRDEIDPVDRLLTGVRIDGGVEQARSRQRMHTALFSGPPTPLRLGRYRLETALASGASGSVYAARDPELERDVAIKVLHGGRKGMTLASRASLRREAQAMARLSHPNVVPIYDVGVVAEDEGTPELRDAVFVVMERLDAGSLTQWLGGARHVDEILDAFEAAGRGLCAAHEAGLVHRDFKPDNVVIAADGRIMVTDFGLATDASARTDGRVVGTPGFMAPEQRKGAPVDARADQYSFCVALHDALGDRATPAIARVLRRGADDDPARRFGSMRALLRALRAARHPGRRRGWLAVLGVGAVLAIGAAFASGGSNEPTRVRGLPDLGTVAEQDGLASTLLAGAEAAADGGRVGEALLIGELACAAGHSAGDPDLLARAQLLHGSNLLAVGDAAGARTRFEAAFETGARARDETLQADAAVRLVSVTGYHLHDAAAGRRWARQAEALVRRDNTPPTLRASLSTHLGNIAYAEGRIDDAVEHLRTAVMRSEKAWGADHPRIVPALNNLGVVLTESGQPTEALVLHRRALELAEAATPPDPLAIAGCWHNVGQAHHEAGDHDAAESALGRALALLEPSFDDTHPRLGHTLVALGRVYADLERWDEALEVSGRALAAWSDEHPQSALAQLTMARAEVGLGRRDEGLARAQRAIAALERTLGPNHGVTRDAEAWLRSVSAATGGT